MKIKLFAIIGMSILLGACTIPGISSKKTEKKLTQDQVEKEVGTSEVIESAHTLEEISKHATPEDCWFAIHDRVYDVTGFGAKHAGSKAVYQGCGIDATELFETRPMGSKTPHSENAREMMDDFEIGILAE